MIGNTECFNTQSASAKTIHQIEPPIRTIKSFAVKINIIVSNHIFGKRIKEDESGLKNIVGISCRTNF